MAVSPENIRKASEAISVFMEKANRRGSALGSYHRLHGREEERLRPKVYDFMRYMKEKILPDLGRLRETDTSIPAVKERFKWGDIKEEGRELLQKPLLETLGEGGEAVVGRRIFKASTHFDILGGPSVEWARKHTGELITQITHETQKAIARRVRYGLEKGEGIRKIARDLRDQVGLTTRQMMANANYEEWLIENRPEYSARRIREMAGAKARRQWRYRARMISRTETANALSEGARQGYGRIGVKRLEWVAAGDCCGICFDKNGKTYSVGRAKGRIPAHPNCKCCWVAAAKEKAVPKKIEDMDQKELERYLHGTYSLDQVNLQGLGKEEMLSVERSFRNYIGKYKTGLRKIRCDRSDRRAYAWVQPWTKTSNDLWLNTRRVGKRTKYKDRWQIDMGTHHSFDHTLGDEAFDSLITHELVHTTAMKQYAKTQAEIKFWKEMDRLYLKNRGKIASIQKNVKDVVMRKRRLQAETVSRYATKNIDEFVAESVADALTGDTPCDISKEVLKLYNKTFKKEGL